MKRFMPLVVVVALIFGLMPAVASAADRGQWAPNVTYNLNDTVTYGGILYKDLQPHTSIVTWEPPNTPALWQPMGSSGGITPTDTQAPTAPSNLTSTAKTTTSISLSWTASTDNVGVTGYTVYQGTTAVGNVTGTTFNHTGLTANTAYTYTVKAKDAAGNLSAASNSLSVTTNAANIADTQAPSVPAGLTVTGTTASSIALSWNASTDNVAVTGYSVYQGTTLVATVTSTSTTVAGLAAATAYTFTVAAKDAAGNASAPSTSVTGTTLAGGSGGGTGGTGGTGSTGTLPKHILTGYWQNFDNGAPVLKVSDVPDQYDIIVLSFADMDLTKPGGVTFNVDSTLASKLGGYTNADLIADIQAKHTKGKKVIISIGGEKGNVDLSSASPNVTNFVDSMYGIITQFGLDGLDIDLENGMNVANVTNAVRQLQQKVGAGFILTMAPQTIDMQSNSTHYMQLYNNLKDIMTVVNVQYYNSGCMLGRDGVCYSQGTINFLTALSDLTLQWIAPSQFGLGVPATSNAAGGGYVSPTVLNNALNCLATGTGCGTYKPVAKYPDIRGAMTWAVNYDKSTNYALANTVRPFLANLP